MNDYLRTLSAGTLTFIVGAMLGFSVRPNEVKLTIEVTPPVFAVTPEKPQPTAEQIYARLVGPTNVPAKSTIAMTNDILSYMLSVSNRLSEEALRKRYMFLTSTQTIESRPTFEQWCRENYHLTNVVGVTNYAPIRR